jgi:hypothetical protein
MSTTITATAYWFLKEGKTFEEMCQVTDQAYIDTVAMGTTISAKRTRSTAPAVEKHELQFQDAEAVKFHVQHSSTAVVLGSLGAVCDARVLELSGPSAEMKKMGEIFPPGTIYFATDALLD